MSVLTDSPLSGANAVMYTSGCDLLVLSRFGDHRIAEPVAYQDGWTIQIVEDASRHGGVVLQGQGRVLHDRSPGNRPSSAGRARPASPIRRRTAVHQHDVLGVHEDLLRSDLELLA